MVNELEKSLDDEVHNCIIVSSYLNNVTILQGGRHSEPLFEKWLSV